MKTKKQYIVPSTTSVEFRSESICLITSVRGGLGWGGEGGGPIDPM
ncbi:MAG: hypothetical protein II825_09635 [Paludibacteraceae bacterium]|nr:hypothetical protein [Paludibacteraceae bacterium]